MKTTNLKLYSRHLWITSAPSDRMKNHTLPWMIDLIEFTISNAKNLWLININININLMFIKLFELVKLIELGKYNIDPVLETKLGFELLENMFSFANYIRLMCNRCLYGHVLMVFVKNLPNKK